MLIIGNALTESIFQFFKVTTALEWCGVITGLLCVWLAAKNSIWNWPIACVSVLIYTYIFFKVPLYGDAGLQIYFLFTNIYGWYYWTKHKNNPIKETPILSITKKEILLSIIGIISFTLILGFTLYHKTDSAFPFTDSFCTASSIIAQVFLARKVLQNWLIWIFVDIIYVGVYFSKELYATGIMYAIYIVIATIGYLDWRKIYRAQTH